MIGVGYLSIPVSFLAVLPLGLLYLLKGCVRKLITLHKWPKAEVKAICGHIIRLLLNTPKKHQKIRTFAIFQKFQWRINILNDSSQFSEDIMEIYIWKN